MKAIIERKRYDTETATEVARWRNSYPVNDFHHYGETLYKTKGGRYFIAGSGGPLSPYAVSVGQSGHCGGQAIRPLSQAEAIQWLEEKGRTEALETEFPDAIEDA